MLEWTPQLSIQVPEMDAQHQRWIELINRLDSAIFEGKGNEIVDDLYVELRSFTDRHFQEEEALLKRRNYPDLEAHHELHRTFVQQMDELEKGAGLKSYKTMQTLKLMQGWLIDHVTTQDRKYGNFLNP